MTLPFDALLTDHGLMRVPLAPAVDVLSEVELAAIRAGVPLPCWSDWEARR